MTIKRIGCKVEVVFEHGRLVGVHCGQGYVHEEGLLIERGPPNLELQFGNDGKIERIVDRSPEVKIFERIVSAMTNEFPPSNTNQR